MRLAAALTGTHPAMGELLVLTPDGPDSFKVAGRIAAPLLGRFDGDRLTLDDPRLRQRGTTVDLWK
ncbi:MAG: hypothetical protein IT513_16440 [Burkholderiales bacterium]|nr:hypothetical protein [Burkholderiales bacterium]